MKWFDRVFQLDLESWMFPLIIERLRGTPARAEDLLSSTSPSLLTAHPSGEWSIQENVGHLIDLEELWNGRIDDFVAGAERLRPADLTNAKTCAARHDAARIDALLTDLRRRRGELVARFEDAQDRVGDRVADHPRLDAPMRLVDLAFFIAEHDDAHLAEISRLLRV